MVEGLLGVADRGRQVGSVVGARRLEGDPTEEVVERVVVQLVPDGLVEPVTHLLAELVVGAG